MSKKIATALVSALLVVCAARADDFGDVAQEVTASMITLPSVDGGELLVNACSGCPTVRLETTATTTWEIGGGPVRLDVLKAEFALRPRQILLLQLTPDRKAVARINMPAAGL